uniref:Small ribosomal subunit protein uS14c n=1 Tax=Lepocinclis tripteris TaxID=135494 RepID=A0A3G3LL08_9EUGL|nr:ribosomal protein S14 [Lepocinclis tripteris]AYQ93387.1 ribosomal protein S14 [Lepocinclis tripteris]
MSKKSMIERELKRERLYTKYLKLRLFLQSKIASSVSFDEKLVYFLKLQKLPRNSCRTRLTNRCFITGRARGYNRFFGLSRHVFREMAHSGFLPGVTKSSW